MGWTQRDIDALSQAGGFPSRKNPPEVKHRVPKQMNKTEARYAQHLTLQQRIGEVAWFAFEDITLRIGKDCRYTPDFAVAYPGGNGRITFHEVKGRRKGNKPFYHDDARVKIAAAAKQYFPLFAFKMVWEVSMGQWESEDF